MNLIKSHLKKIKENTYVRHKDYFVIQNMALSKEFVKTFENEFSSDFELSPVTIKPVLLGNKIRPIAHLEPQDHLFHSILTEILLESYSHKNLFSYTKGRSSYLALRRFAKWIRKNMSSDGLYIYKSDIHQYTETIPINDDSLLWKQIADLTNTDISDMVKKCLRVETTDGYCRRIGVYFGTPIAPAIYNIYAKEIDVLCEDIDFAIRYGDDILIASKDKEKVLTLKKKLHDVLSKLHLSLKKEKDQTICLSKSGFSSSEIKGTDSFEYLGFRVFADGTLGLPKRKVRELLQTLRRKLVQSRKIKVQDSFDEELDFYIEITNNFLFDPLWQHKYATVLINQVTSRRQLKEIDGMIVQLLSRTMTKDDSKLSESFLRKKGLGSLVMARNKL